MRKPRILLVLLLTILAASCSLETGGSNIDDIFTEQRPEPLAAGDLSSLFSITRLLEELDGPAEGLSVTWFPEGGYLTAKVDFNDYNGPALARDKSLEKISSGSLFFRFTIDSSNPDSLLFNLSAYDANTTEPLMLVQSGNGIEIENAFSIDRAESDNLVASLAVDDEGRASFILTSVSQTGAFVVTKDGETSAVSQPWTGDADMGWYESGKSSFTIASAEDLAGLAQIVNDGTDSFEGKTVTLACDIDLGGKEWTPIGKSTRSGSVLAEGSTPFKGVFDGQGHSITCLKVTQGAEDDGIGLFSALSGEGAAIRNLKVSGSVENSASGAAALVVGFILDNACVENVETLEGSTVSAKEGAGIVGRMIASGTISNAVNRASVETVGGKAAGIVFAAYYDQYPGTSGEGQTYDDFKVVDCVNYGAVESNSNCIGGIVGIATTVSIEDCVNYGSVTGGGYGIGGIAGELKHGAAIIRCVNNGSVTSKASSSASFGIGGLAGWIRYDGASSVYNDLLVSRIEDSENHGDVTTSSNTGIGGAIGHIHNAATISGTKNYGNVTLASQDGLMIGGFVGGLQAEKNGFNEHRNTISFTDCYTDADAVSAPEGTTNEGDFVGHPNAPTDECNVVVQFSNCFYGDTSYTWPAQ